MNSGKRPADPMTLFRSIFSFLILLALAACEAPTPEDNTQTDRRAIEDLTQLIQNLGPEVNPAEAARAARISVTYSRQLQTEYQVEDPPLLHNWKVNRGLKPRGLCYHWADDLEARLAQENFQTLSLHRAIANATNIRIEHSTTIVSRRGDAFDEGVIVDPWRYGGTLYWSKVLEDTRYIWVQRDEVFEWKRARDARNASGG